MSTELELSYIMLKHYFRGKPWPFILHTLEAQDLYLKIFVKWSYGRPYKCLEIDKVTGQT